MSREDANTGDPGPAPSIAHRAACEALRWTLVLLPALLVLQLRSVPVGAVYHVLNRVVYLVYVSVVLAPRSLVRAQERRPATLRDYERFRSRASWIMHSDAASFVVLILLSARTLPVLVPQGWAIGLGILLGILGIGSKLWAARTLGEPAYYWYDFFVPAGGSRGEVRGPYRFLRNPMYTVGYAHAYGLALAFLSWPGLLAAAFDQAGVLVFHYAIEAPHVRLVYASQAPAPTDEGAIVPPRG